MSKPSNTSSARGPRHRRNGFSLAIGPQGLFNSHIAWEGRSFEESHCLCTDARRRVQFDLDTGDPGRKAGRQTNRTGHRSRDRSSLQHRRTAGPRIVGPIPRGNLLLLHEGRHGSLQERTGEVPRGWYPHASRSQDITVNRPAPFPFLPNRSLPNLSVLMCPDSSV